MQISPEIPAQTLPVWMRKALRGVDWGVLLVIAFSLTVSWPFLFQPGLPRTNASENYAFRTAEYAASIEEGRLYPRWSPQALGGYGAPIPHFYPPGAPYAAALLQLLFTDDPVIAVRILYVASLVVAGTVLYAGVTRRASAAAGVLASILYLGSPHLGLVAPHMLGDLPGVMTMALTPTLLWSTDRLLAIHRPFDMALVALTTAALLLTDVRAGLMGMVLAILVISWHWWTQDRRAPILWVVAGLLIGISLAAFYWLPALLDLRQVTWQSRFLTQSPSVTLAGLFVPPSQIDLGELKPAVTLSLGWVQLAFALAAGVRLTLMRRRIAYERLFLTIAIVLIGLTVTFWCNEAWLLGVIALCFAIIGGQLAEVRLQFVAMGQRLWLASLAAIALAGSLAVWLAPAWPANFGDISAQAEVDYEQEGYGIAVLPPGAPLPRTIPETLQPSQTLLNGYRLGTINKIANDPLSTGVVADLLAHNSYSDRFHLRIRQATELNILTSYFPGWRATLAGRPVPLGQNLKTGLIQVTVPEIENGELNVLLDTTHLRSSAWSVSCAALSLGLIITWGRFRRAPGGFDDLRLLTVREARTLSIVVGCFIVGVGLWVIPLSPYSLRQPEGHRLVGSTPLYAQTESGLTVLAFRLNSSAYRPADSIELTVHWQALRPQTVNYRSQVFLFNLRDGTRWEHSGLRHPGDYPTARWQNERYITDHYQLLIDNVVPNGPYVVALEVYTCNPMCGTESRSAFFGPGGNPLGATLFVPTIITISR